MSFRQTEPAYGLPGWKIEPNIVIRAPSQPPVSPSSRRNVSTAGMNRLVKNTTEATPCFSTVLTSVPAASVESAIGLSSSRCLPAAAARVASSA